MRTRRSSVAQRTRAKTLEKLRVDCQERKGNNKANEKSNATNAKKRKKRGEEKKKECNPKESKKRKEKEKSSTTDAVKREKKGEKTEKECDPKKFKKRKRSRKVSGPGGEEESDSDVQIVSVVRMSDRSVHVNVDDDEDEESDSDAQIVSEAYVRPSDRSYYLTRSKFLPRRSNRGRRNENLTTERMNNGKPSRGQSKVGATKAKDMIVENSGSSNSESSSSEEEEDDSGDDDYMGEESGGSDTQSDESSYCSEDDMGEVKDRDDGKINLVERSDEERKNCDDDDEGSVRKMKTNASENLVQGSCCEEQLSCNGDGFKKKRAYGLDIWVDVNRRDCEKEIRRPIRLRRRSVSESKKKELRLGTYSQPVPVHENDDYDSSDDDGVHSDRVAKKNKESCEKVRKVSKKRGCPAKVVNVKNAINLFMDSIFDGGEELNNLLAPNDKKLPLKFRFEDEDPTPPEKEEWQKEIDNLFAELEMGLAGFDSDVNTSSMCLAIDELNDTLKLMEKDENIHVAAKASTPAERCLLGDHLLTLEEPIGIVCKCCHLVCVEMKDIFPDLIIPPPRKQDWTINYGTDGCYIFDEIHSDELARENNSTTIHGKYSVLELIPANIRRNMYRHQIDGFLFLWKNVVGETCIEKLKSHSSTERSGCIISHAPGTGKTCLSIVFIMSLIEIYPECRPVIIAPRGMLLTWEEEFSKWGAGIPFHNLNNWELSGKESEVVAGLTPLLSRVGNGTQERKHFNRMAKLYSWVKHRSVLGVSYQSFEKLVNGAENGRHDGKVRKILLELPGLLVLDEGHTPRNENSCIWKALTKVETWRRIILSGTPFQNNFDELYNTLSLVNPKLSQSISRWNSLTNAIDKEIGKSVAELRAMIDPFVHVHKGTILQERLPGLKDTLVILRPTEQQKKALQLIPDDVNQFDKVHLISLISVHPSLAATKEFLANDSRLRLLGSSPNTGVKTKFVMELVNLCDALKEKVLIFSECIDSLNFIKKQLEDQLSWREGREVLYMDGKQDEKRRQSSINSLNNPRSEAKVFLASTRACSEGINLVGASRVVLLDVVWNPSVERQAISRAYRLGQKKMVYVYHLIMSGTLELSKYARQTKKYRLSEVVFSCQENKKAKIPAAVADDKILESMNNNKKLNDIFETIVHNPKESDLFENFCFVELQH